MSYDAAGSLTKDKDSYEYEYDYESRIVKITKNSQTKAEFAYDALGRRIQKKDLIDPNNTRRYYYNYKWQVLAEYDGSDTLQRIFIYGNYIDEVLLMKAGENDYYYAHDHLYSSAALIDTSGNVLERYEYDAYGNPTIWNADFTTERESSNYGNPYLFTGRRVDILDSGSWKLQYNRNRYYDYYSGRWLTHDPAGYVDGLNLYEYVEGNPIIYVDPFGLWIVNRNNGSKASAESEEGDTIDDLADCIGLETVQWRNWLTFLSDEICVLEKGSVSVNSLSAYTELCPYQKVKIPNTVMAYWAGTFGIAGKLWVNWYDDIKRLEKRGFNVPEVEGLTASGLEGKIESMQGSKTLHGIFAWGHGSKSGFKTWDLGGPAYFSYYSNWEPVYRMALGIIWACHSGDGEAERHFSDGAIFQGAEGILVPKPFHLFGPWTDEIVGPGAQGTNP